MFLLSRLDELLPYKPNVSRGMRAVCRLVLLLTTVSSTAYAQDLTVEAVAPASGAEGTEVVVLGEGFSADPSDHWVFVHSQGTGLGVVLEPVEGDASSWVGALGPAAEAHIGPLTVWKGSRQALSAEVIEGEAGTYFVQRADWFVRRDAAEAPVTFHVTDPSEKTVGSLALGVAVVVDLSSNPGMHRIDLNVTIDGGSAGGSGGGEGSVAPSKPLGGPENGSRALILEMLNLDPQVSTPEASAMDLSRVLMQIYGGLGLRARAQGAMVHIYWTGAPTFERAFAVLRERH